MSLFIISSKLLKVLLLVCFPLKTKTRLWPSVPWQCMEASACPGRAGGPSPLNPDWLMQPAFRDCPTRLVHPPAGLNCWNQREWKVPSWPSLNLSTIHGLSTSLVHCRPGCLLPWTNANPSLSSWIKMWSWPSTNWVQDTKMKKATTFPRRTSSWQHLT